MGGELVRRERERGISKRDDDDQGCSCPCCCCRCSAKFGRCSTKTALGAARARFRSALGVEGKPSQSAALLCSCASPTRVCRGRACSANPHCCNWWALGQCGIDKIPRVKQDKGAAPEALDGMEWMDDLRPAHLSRKRSAWHSSPQQTNPPALHATALPCSCPSCLAPGACRLPPVACCLLLAWSMPGSLFPQQRKTNQPKLLKLNTLQIQYSTVQYLTVLSLPFGRLAQSLGSQVSCFDWTDGEGTGSHRTATKCMHRRPGRIRKHIVEARHSTGQHCTSCSLGWSDSLVWRTLSPRRVFLMVNPADPDRSSAQQ